MIALGASRRRRRQLLCAGWLGSVVVSGLGMAALCAFGGTACLVGVVLASGVLALWHRWMKREGGVPVLVYHSVTEERDWLPWSWEISLSPETFARHLETIRALGCQVVRTRDLVAARRTGKALPDRPVVIHFDDGYLDNWVAALPLLKRYQMTATIFVTLDFIEPGETPRPTLDDVAAGRCAPEELRWAGYLNWAELRSMQESGVLEVEAHGVDHTRVEVGPRVVDTIGPENWRQLAWVQWRGMAGDKSGWFRLSEPPIVPYGAQVRENRPALSAPAWSADGQESEREYESRVGSALARCREVLGAGLGKEIEIFCWPYSVTNAKTHELALATGYLATTGGAGENRGGEDATVISRTPVTDRPFGWHWPAAESLALRAKLRLFQGNYYWYFLVLLMDQCRKLAVRLARPAGRRPN